MRTKRALITGITGQDGAYLAKNLVQKGYDVYGCFRRNASGSAWRLHELGIADQVKMCEMEMTELSCIINVIDAVKPDEIYNLAAQSFVASAFLQPFYTSNVDGFGAARIMEAVKLMYRDKIKIYQAGTSEMYGKVQAIPQTETTPFYPRSPYGCAKVYAYWMGINYRESYNMFITNGILFNHESPIRGEVFVTRKITSILAQKAAGVMKEPLILGNLDAKRDWGHAADYVEGMWLMMQQETPGDYILATGETHTVREFVNLAAEFFGYDLVWEGEGVNERAIDARTKEVVVCVSPEFYRPAEVDILLGDPSKAERELGWKRTVTFEELVRVMCRADQARVRRIA